MAEDRRESSFGTAAYGGESFSRRSRTHKEDIGPLWRECGIDSEWRQLRAVLVHRPGDELGQSSIDPDGAQMLAPLDIGRAQAEHDQMVAAYEDAGVAVHHVLPDGEVSANQMFCADSSVMTPQGAILARPASTIRAGEERQIARRLAALGIPILKTLTGTSVFEGADLMWLDEATAVIGRGPRTNQTAIDQITATLNEIDCEVLAVDLPYATMHLMGMFRIVDADLAVVWPRRTPNAVVRWLAEHDVCVATPPFVNDNNHDRAINFVTLGPRRILMVDGLPEFQEFYEKLGIHCTTAPTDELSKAAGNIGCLTGVLHRSMA